MKEFMLFIRNQMGHHEAMPAEEEQLFLRKCKEYIEDLTKSKKLKIAQPLERKGKMLSGTKGAWETNPFNEGKEVIVGYYHILANDLDEAIIIAQGNPEFAFSKTARIEVRPIKTKEETTGYTYPENL